MDVKDGGLCALLEALAVSGDPSTGLNIRH